MGFNFSHPQKSGGAMAPLAPPSEGALAGGLGETGATRCSICLALETRGDGANYTTCS